MKEKVIRALPGIPVLLFTLVGTVYSIVQIIANARHRDPLAILWVLAALALFVAMFGCFQVQPNQGAVLTLFGKYQGTVKDEGLRWANPFYSKRAISLRTRNFETKQLKVNDHDGNPIEIAAVVVWRIVDTAEAVFQVDNYENYIAVQSEAALRNMATAYPYDAHNAGQFSLRANTAEIAAHLQTEIQDRLKVAGIEVIESRISHLAYAAEIAAAMLQRQQASAIVAARTKIVEGAVGMVHMALDALAERGAVQLDEERKAAMVSNLLVVLCGERAAQPVVNAGTIYH